MIKNENLLAPLSRAILQSYNKLITAIQETSYVPFFEKKYHGTGALVNKANLIAYQIGWATLLLYWYKTGLNQNSFEMPGDGFNVWNYKKIALHFYEKYEKISQEKLLKQFEAVVKEIIDIVELEYKKGNLDTFGVFNWCTLQSGKQWPLSKWVQVNTVAPYKRATLLIKNS